MKPNKPNIPESQQPNNSNQFQRKIKIENDNQMTSQLPGLEEISGISKKNSNSDPENEIAFQPDFQRIPENSHIQKLQTIPVQDKDDLINNQNEKNKMRPFLQLNETEPFSINVKSKNKRKMKKTKVQLDPSMNTFLEDIRTKGNHSFFHENANNNDSKMSLLNPIVTIPSNSNLEANKMNSFSFRGSAVANSKDFNNSLFRKKKQEGRFTEINHLPTENMMINDTSINNGLLPIPMTGITFQNEMPRNNLPSFHMDKSFNIPRHVNPAGSNPDFLSNMDQSFQKHNESGFNEILGPTPSNNLLGNPSILENLNNSFKEYPNVQNISLNYEKNMNRLDRADNSFNLSMYKPSLAHYNNALNDTLNQSGQFKLRYKSKANLDNSFTHYIGNPKANTLTMNFTNKEIDTSEIKQDQNTSFDNNTQNILSLLDKANTTQPIQEKFEEELESFGMNKKEKENLSENQAPEKFFMNPEMKEKKGNANPLINGKIQRIENNVISSENKSESSLQENNLKNSDIINYIINNYSAQCINNVVSAKCAKYMKKKPDIFEMINSVISKNKKWKKILDLVQKELSKNDGSSDSDNVKSTFSITTEQKKNDTHIVNKININFNTEVKYQGVPWKLAKYLKRRKKRKRKRRKCRKSKEVGMPDIEAKMIKGYSERYSSSNESNSSGQIMNCKRVKQDISSKSDGKMMTSFISDNKNKGGINFFDAEIKQPPKSDIGDLSEGPEEIIVVKKTEDPKKKDGLLNKRGFKKRKRGRPKGSKNSKTSSVRSKAFKMKKYSRRGRKKSLKERMKNVILNNGESYGMNSDMDSISVVRSRRSGRRRKKSDISKNYDEESFNGLRGNKKKIYDILRITFTEMSITSQSHADFLNSELHEAEALRNILKKKFDIKNKIEVEKLKMKKEKKRNEEINKFVVKRCMKYLMKKNRDKSINKIEDESLSVVQDTKQQNKNSNTLNIPQNKTLLKKLKNQQDLASVTSIFPKDAFPHFVGKDIGSISNISMQQDNANSTLERNITFRPPSSKLLSNPRNNLISQSEFPNLNELNDEALPNSSAIEQSFNKGVFGPKKIDMGYHKNNNILDGLKENTINVRLDQKMAKNLKKEEPKETNKMLAHSKLLSEHQFYLKYFKQSSVETNTPLEKYYLPNTKLANNANKDNKDNKEAQSYKTINIKYIRLILRSRMFSKSIKDFLNNIFEIEYRETRFSKLRLLAKSINNDKYVKSVKLPWTMHEINEAQSTFMKLIETTEKDIYGTSKKKKGTKGSNKKKKNNDMVIRENRMTRKRTRMRNELINKKDNEDNFQACFANSNNSNKFLGS